MNWVMYIHLRKYLAKTNIITISDDADIDMQQIFEYIKINSIYYAMKTKEKIGERILDLNSLPYMGRKVPEYNKEYIRELIYKSYRIIYQIKESCIYIQRIFHSKRLISKNLIQR